MAERDPRRKSDGFVILDGGMDSGRAPNAIGKNQLAFLLNGTMRGGFPMCRPGYKKRLLSFPDQEGIEDATLKARFEDGLFQGAGYFRAPNGTNQVVTQIGGRLFSIRLDDFKVLEVTPPDLSSAVLLKAWMYQAEDWLIVQNAQDRPIIYNGAVARRASDDEVPCGTAGTYAMGRIWQSRPWGKAFTAGDLVYSSSGTPQHGYRDAVLKFTENELIAGGGSFGVPADAGLIRAIRPLANIDTSLGQGPVQVLCERCIFSVNAPFDRTVWANLNYPIQTVSALQHGAVSDAVDSVNSDLWYRSDDGFRSFILSRREIREWANTPDSFEMDRVLKFDDPRLKEFSSSCLFDNRWLITVSPAIKFGHGIIHRGLVALDFSPVSLLGSSTQPHYDGLWTGLNILKILCADDRCFAFVLNASDKVELWEITKDERFDNGANRIVWGFETRRMDFQNPFELKELQTGNSFHDRLAGTVDFDLDYRPDAGEDWLNWDNWQYCANYRDCEAEECKTFIPQREQYRPKKGFVQPQEGCDTNSTKSNRLGYEFQAKLTVTGFARIQRLALNALWQEESPVGECTPTTAACADSKACATNDFSYSSI